MSAKHSRGIIKNRPALGEQALQELMKDNLLKFNYFLTDARGRNVKSYMKAPIPSQGDLIEENFRQKLQKHRIDIDEYRSVYETSSIPPQNSLSKMTLEILKRDGAFVGQYSKYKIQLSELIKNLIEKGAIVQNDEESFSIRNPDAFDLQFHDIENLVTGGRTQQISSQPHAITTGRNLTTSRIELSKAKPTEDNFHDVTSQSRQEFRQHSATNRPIHHDDPDMAGKGWFCMIFDLHNCFHFYQILVLIFWFS